MPQWYMPTAIPLAIVCVLSSSLLDPAGTCNTRLPPFGPRLFRAKVLFGEAMRLCSKELLAVAKTIPPHKLNKLLVMSCMWYNKCKDAIQENTKEPFLDCILVGVRYESAPVYRDLKISLAFKQAAEKAVGCLKALIGPSVDRQAIDDAVAFARQAILTFGWT
ncbi:uncharacterized protein LOC144103928 isoform X2 [Amblyomma americanum]